MGWMAIVASTARWLGGGTRAGRVDACACEMPSQRTPLRRVMAATSWKEEEERVRWYMYDRRKGATGVTQPQCAAYRFVPLDGFDNAT